jgi:alanine racemase
MLSWVEVERGTLLRNAHNMRRLLKPGVKLCGVIKGNGFGHGLVPAARALVAGGTEWHLAWRGRGFSPQYGMRRG